MPPEQYIEPEQRLTSPAQIAGILKRLHDERSLLSCSFPGGREIYNSAVLTVDPAAGVFTLDELNPRSGHDRIQPGTEIRVEGSLQGVDTRFVFKVGEVKLENGIYDYSSPLPEYLIYRQRRQYHRVPVRMTLHAVLNLDGEKKATTARLTDLSAGGVGGLVLEGGRLEAGSHHSCQIQLPGQPVLTIPIEIRFAQTDSRGQQRFGAMFLEISPMDRRRIARTVMDLERELRRLS